MCGFRNAWAVLIRQLFDAVKLISVYHIEKNSIISVIKISGILSYDEWSKIPPKSDKLSKYERNWFIVDTGDPSHFKSVISFKFRDGKIY